MEIDKMTRYLTLRGGRITAAADIRRLLSRMGPRPIPQAGRAWRALRALRGRIVRVRIAKAIGAACIAVTTGIVTACAGGGAQGPLSASGSAGPSDETALHAVMSQRLTLQFASLNALLFDLHRTETELAEQRARQLREISTTASKLQSAAAAVRGMDSESISESLTLSDDELSRFRSLAGRLESQAANLADLADTGRLQRDQAETLVEEFYGTCDSCHSIYRERMSRYRSRRGD